MFQGLQESLGSWRSRARCVNGFLSCVRGASSCRWLPPFSSSHFAVAVCCWRRLISSCRILSYPHVVRSSGCQCQRQIIQDACGMSLVQLLWSLCTLFVDQGYLVRFAKGANFYVRFVRQSPFVTFLLVPDRIRSLPSFLADGIGFSSLSWASCCLGGIRSSTFLVRPD